MAVFAKSTQTDWVNAPDGVHDAVCVDIVDLGMKETQFGPKHKIRVVWEIAAKTEDGVPFTVGKQYGLSLHEKADLRKDLKGWRGGKDFTTEELRGPTGDGFDLETIIGKSCQLLVQQEPSKEGKVYANVKNVLKAKVKLEPSGKYVRVKDRKPSDAKPVANNGKPASAAEPVEEIPF